MGKLSLLYPRIYTVALLPFLSLMTTGAIFMAIGALVLSGDIENGYIGASHVYFPKVESIRDASIQIISPYRVEEDDLSKDVDRPFLGCPNSLQPLLLKHHRIFTGWTQ